MLRQPVSKLYQIPNATRNDHINVLSLYGKSDSATAQAELNIFLTKYVPQIKNGTHPKVFSVDRGNITFASANSTDNNVETELDIQTAYALMYPGDVIVYQVEDSIQAQNNSGSNRFLDALDVSYCIYSAYGVTGNTPGVDATYPDPEKDGFKGELMCGVFPPMKVISVPYGPSEFDLLLNYSRRQCNECLKLGLRRLQCRQLQRRQQSLRLSRQKRNRLQPFLPNLPLHHRRRRNSPLPHQNLLDRESALQWPYKNATTFTSAVIFSNYFPLPAYQRSAVTNYFTRHDPGLPSYTARYNCTNVTNIGENGGVYNRAGRGFPDVSALGGDIKFVHNSTAKNGGGTSFSAPIWASIVTLINEERTAVGNGSVGFINPTLYEYPGMLNDFVNGSNPGCKSAGFKAVPGWDPVTGLGTPNYPKLLHLFMSLP